MPVSLRPVVECDSLALAKLGMSDEDMNYSQVPSVAEIIDKAIENGNAIRGVYSNDTLVGLMHHSPVPDGGDYDLYHFFIDGKQRGRGYGESALRVLIEELQSTPHVTTLRLSYMFFNTAAEQLYKKLGFKIDEDENEYGERQAYFAIARPATPVTASA